MGIRAFQFGGRQRPEASKSVHLCHLLVSVLAKSVFVHAAASDLLLRLGPGLTA